MKVGLRFRRSQIRVLDALTERAELREVPEAVSLLRAASTATRAGEPLILECADLDEARRVAQGFANWEIRPPTLEDRV